MPGIAASSSVVFASMLLPVRLGHVVDDDRQVDRIGDRAIVRDDAALRRLVVHRRRVQQVRRAGRLRRLRQRDRLCVSLEPAPATIGTRPFACSTTISTTRRCSSAVIVAASPVLPHGTRK